MESWRHAGPTGYRQEMDVLQAIGRRIAALRRERGLTQEKLAERVGIAAAHLARIETGKRSPSLEVLVALARALAVPPWRLFTADRLTRDEEQLRDAERSLLEAVRELAAPDVEHLAESVRRLRRPPP